MNIKGQLLLIFSIHDDIVVHTFLLVATLTLVVHM